jgi:hypothetical protein
MYADNPFFTTAGGGGSATGFSPHSYPTIPGVNGGTIPIYPSVAVGVQGTAATLLQYPHIMAALNSGNPDAYARGPNGSDFSAELLKWSGSGYSGFSLGASVPYGPGIERPISGATGWKPTNVDAYGNTNPLSGIPIAGSIFGAGQKTGETAGNIVSSVSSVGGLIKEISNPIFWLRVAEIVGGAILIGIGIYLVAKDMGFSPPKPPGPAGKVLDKGESVVRDADFSESGGGESATPDAPISQQPESVQRRAGYRPRSRQRREGFTLDSDAPRGPQAQGTLEESIPF